MPPQFQRMLPFFFILILLLFVLPQILKKHKSGPSSKTKTAQTLEAMTLIRQGEKGYTAAHGRYTSHLADLVALKPKLATDLAIDLAVELDVSADGQSYVAQVASNVISLVRAQSGTKVLTRSCLVLKSGSGVKCPPGT